MIQKFLSHKGEPNQKIVAEVFMEFSSKGVVVDSSVSV